MPGVPCGNSPTLLLAPAQLISGSETSSHLDSSLRLACGTYWHGKNINMYQIYSCYELLVVHMMNVKGLLCTVDTVVTGEEAFWKMEK